MHRILINKNIISFARFLLYKPFILIYPIFLTIILLFFRYLRLGNSIEIVNFYNTPVITLIIIVPFLWPYISIWLRLILWKIMELRLLLWNDFIITIIRLHTFFLKFNVYFYITSKLHKIAFLLHTFIIYDGFIYSNEKRNRIRLLIHKLYLYPILSTMIVWIICLFELIVSGGKLKYSLYLLFILIIFRIILSSINEFASSNWPYHVCISDYIYQRWDHPRYPIEFWYRFPTYVGLTGISFDISNELQQALVGYIECNTSNRNITKKNWFKLVKNKRMMHSTCVSIKLNYYKWHNIRWTHTEAVRKALHPMTSLFARNFTDYVASINNNWSHFHIIEQAKKAIPYNQQIYENFAMPSTNVSKISKVIEHNLITNFNPLKQLGIKVSIFHNNIKRDTSHQARDDILIDTKNSQVIDSRLHGLDQKAVSAFQIKDPSSVIFSQISHIEYGDIITRFEKLLIQKNNLSLQDIVKTQEVFQQLVETCNDIATHQIIWAKNLHLFPDNSIPPLRVPNNFSMEDFKPEIRESLRQSNFYMQKVSDHLHAKRVPCDYKKAIEYMDNDFIQNMFKEIT